MYVTELSVKYIKLSDDTKVTQVLMRMVSLCHLIHAL